MKSLEKYAQYFRRTHERDPSDPKELLEYLLKNDYANEIQPIKTYIHLKKSPLPIPKKIYERYPEFREYKIESRYIGNCSLAIDVISMKIDEFNKEKTYNSAWDNILNNVLTVLTNQLTSKE